MMDSENMEVAVKQSNIFGKYVVWLWIMSPMSLQTFTIHCLSLWSGSSGIITICPILYIYYIYSLHRYPILAWCHRKMATIWSIAFNTKHEINFQRLMLMKVLSHPGHGRQLDLFQFLEDVSPLIHEASPGNLHTDQYLLFDSHHPLEHKLGVSGTLNHRAEIAPTKTERKEEKQKNNRGALGWSGYPKLDLCQKRQRSRRSFLDESWNFFNCTDWSVTANITPTPMFVSHFAATTLSLFANGFLQCTELNGKQWLLKHRNDASKKYPPETLRHTNSLFGTIIFAWYLVL